MVKSRTQINGMKDIRVIFDSDLKFEKYININCEISTANKILDIIKTSFMCLSAEIVAPPSKASVKSHFNYAIII